VTLERLRPAGRARRAAALTALALSLALGIAPRAVAAGGNPPLFYSDRPDAAAFRAQCEAEIGNAQEALGRVLAVQGRRTIENTLSPYNEMMLHADNAAYMAGLMESVHPDSIYRTAAEAMTQKAQKFLSDATLNRGLYDAVRAVDVKKADGDTRFMVERALRDFRRAGVDQDEAARNRIAAIRDQLVLIGQEFDRNIRNDSRKITLDHASDLDGLPEDFIRAHPAGPDGKITISIEYPDRFPVMKYAKNAEVRRRLTLESRNRAYPQNMAVLDSLLVKRYELARLLGYKTWADYVTEDKMIRTPRRASEFLDKVGALVAGQSKREYEVYLKRKREDVPDAKAVENWEVGYYANLIRKRDYDIDAQAVRPYFAFDKVKQGVLDVTSRIFGVTYKRIDGAVVWDPSVEAYEVYEGDRLLGRFFFDLHPRPGKFNHAAQFTIRQGCAGIQMPEAALVCNLPGGKPNDPGLMEHGDVVTFFHEFGHLLHTIFAGGQRWEPLAGISTEWDFVEAPSQMLEEWAWYPSSLQTFAKHYQTGEPIPAATVDRMRRADAFGRGIDRGYQTYLSEISLHLYDREPSLVNSDSVVARAEREIVPFPPVPNTHMQCAFGHLDGYSAIYYTYLWSQVIAKDLFSRFDREHLLEPTVPTRYRKTVLAPGGSRTAQTLVHDFLKRDFNTKAFDAYVREEMD
jgi:thimet oligopeptidase